MSPEGSLCIAPLDNIESAQFLPPRLAGKAWSRARASVQSDLFISECESRYPY
jgi:hypothetical protein